MHYLLARVLLAGGRLPEAEQAARTCTTLDPEHADAWGLTALIRAQRRDAAGALEAAAHGLRIDPDHDLCLNVRAMALVRTGQKGLAVHTMEGALKRRPDDAFTHANTGWTLLHQGDVRKAEVHFREALRLDPNLDWAREGVLEALKARNPLYRVFLRYKLWMDALTVRRRFFVILGGYALYRIALSVAKAAPAIAPVLWVVVGAYIAFCLLTWFGDPIFNLLLLLHPLGRHALKPREKTGALLVCGSIGTGVIIGAWGLAHDHVLFMLAGLYLALLGAPLQVAFQIDPGRVARALTAFTGALVLLAAGTIGMLHANESTRRELMPLIERAQAHEQQRLELTESAAQHGLTIDGSREELREKLRRLGPDGQQLSRRFAEFSAENAALEQALEDARFAERGRAFTSRQDLFGVLSIAYPLLCLFGSQLLASWLLARNARR